MQSKTGITLLTALLVSMVLSISGCSAPSAEQQLRLQLDSLSNDGKTEFSVTGQSAYKWKLRKAEIAFERKLENASNPAERRHFAAVLSLFKLFNAVFTTEDVFGKGRSVFIISDELVHEKSILLYAPAEKGLIKTFFNSHDTVSPQALMDDIPERAIAVFAADIQVKEILKVLEASSGFSEVLASKIPAGLPVAEIVQGIDGVWQVTLLQADEKNTAVKLDIPDKDSRIFNMFSMASNLPKGKRRLFLPGIGTFIRNTDRLTLYIGNRTEIIFNAAEKDKLNADKKLLLSQMPDKTVFFAYVDPRRIGKDIKELSIGRLFWKQAAEMDEPFTLALSRLAEADGYLISANGNGRILAQDMEFFNDIILPLFADCLPDKTESSAVSKPRNDNAEVGKCSCSATLAAAGEFVRNNPDLKAGFYRINEDKLILCGKENFDVVIFKTAAFSRVLPILISPAHKDGFCACDAAGNITRYQLKKPDSLLRIAGFLHTVYKFDEKVFRELVLLAEALDGKQGK